jgi:hypothetical protein
MVDTRQGKSLKLITPDCIFIPFENPKHKGVVPQFESAITRDFDQLFNQIIASMCQRMVNHIGMYRVSVKK